MFNVAIVGSGPSGLFLAKNLLKSLPSNLKIDIFEKLPVPFGLLKFGVAPDHAEVKQKFLHHFDAIFDSEYVQMYVNADIGNRLKVHDLSKYYDVVALCTGMPNSKRNWKGVPNCYGADEIFGWYNMNPLMKPLEKEMSKIKNLLIIGNGNVALDMARIFAKRPSVLAKENIDSAVLNVLKDSGVKEITILGRKGIESASFTPAELREFKTLSDYCKITTNIDFKNINTENSTRIQAKNIQIIQNLTKSFSEGEPDKRLNFRFLSPVKSISEENGRGIVSIIDEKTGKLENLIFDMLIECTGFKQNQLFENLHQDEIGKFVTTDGHFIRDNIYACGWSRTGSKGNVADSIIEAVNCSSTIVKNLKSKSRDLSKEDWRKIDPKIKLLNKSHFKL